MIIEKFRIQKITFTTLIVLLSALFIFSSCSVEKSKKIKVAFCNLPQEVE